MAIEFDPTKDAADIAKHGVSLARASDLEEVTAMDDHRFAEPRRRAYGMLDGRLHCLAYLYEARTSAPSAFAGLI